MAGHSYHPSWDRDTETVRLPDLLDGISRTRVLVAELQHRNRLYARQTKSGELEALRLNRKGRLCWRRPIERRRLLRLVQSGVEAGGSVELASYEEGWPSRFRGDSARTDGGFQETTA